MPGWPSALKTGVNGVNRPERVKVAIGSGAGRVERPERERALGERRREQRVVGRKEGDQLAGERLQLHGQAHALHRVQLLDHREDRPAHRLHVLRGRLVPAHDARSRRSTWRCGSRTPRRTSRSTPPPATADRPPPPRGRASAAARRPRRPPAQHTGSTTRIGDRRERGRRDPQAAAAIGDRPRPAPAARPRRTARTAAAPRWRRRSHSRRARRGSPPCRRRCA